MVLGMGLGIGMSLLPYPTSGKQFIKDAFYDQNTNLISKNQIILDSVRSSNTAINDLRKFNTVLQSTVNANYDRVTHALQGHSTSAGLARQDLSSLHQQTGDLRRLFARNDAVLDRLSGVVDNISQTLQAAGASMLTTVEWTHMTLASVQQIQNSVQNDATAIRETANALQNVKILGEGNLLLESINKSIEEGINNFFGASLLEHYDKKMKLTERFKDIESATNLPECITEGIKVTPEMVTSFYKANSEGIQQASLRIKQALGEEDFMEPIIKAGLVGIGLDIDESSAEMMSEFIGECVKSYKLME